jgi:hypothetical protein
VPTKLPHAKDKQLLVTAVRQGQAPAIAPPARATASPVAHPCVPVTRPTKQPVLNWPLVVCATALTFFVLAGLAITAWSVIASAKDSPPAPAQRQPQPAVAKLKTLPGKTAKVLRDSTDPSLPEELTAPTAPSQAPLSWTGREPELQLDSAAKPTTADPTPAKPSCESYGTSVQFVSNQSAAARQALHDNKLLFVLHVSGNFEDSKFT